MFDINPPVSAPVLDDVNVNPDPLATPPAMLDSHGDDEFWHEQHCSTSGCLYPRGHNGPCSNYHKASINVDTRPSSNLRPRARSHAQSANTTGTDEHDVYVDMRSSNRSNFTRQERINLRSFLFKALFLTASATADHLDPSSPLVGHIPSLLFATAYNETLFVQTDATAHSIPIPRGIRQALASEHSERWLEAILSEYTSILSHNVFTVMRRVDLPAGTNVMRCHAVFTVRAKKDGSIERYKCRLVADGNTQEHLVDFDEIFSTVVKFSTLRMGLHLAAVRNYNITAIDISTAFLYGLIDNPNCYMQMPEGLPKYDQYGFELVCHLLKSIYGLRQAPRIFFNHFRASLLAFGFIQSKVDPCLFIYEAGSTVIYGLLWVDDLVCFDNNPTERQRLVTFLREQRKYTLTDKGEVDWLLGIALTRDRPNRLISLSQELYIKKLCDKYGPYLEESNARSFDIPATDEISSFSRDECPTEGSAEYIQMQPLFHVYMSLIGAYIWLSSCTLAHLCIVTNVLSRFTLRPARRHFKAAIRVLLYLRKHSHHALVLGGVGPDAEVLTINTDANHDGGPSISGVFIVMGTAVIHWICRRQKSASRSSLEAEALANAEGAQDGIYQRELAKEFGVKVRTTNFWTDSDASIKLHSNDFACKKSKHIIRVIIMLRDWILDRVYRLLFISGNCNYVDILTKPLALDPFRRFRDAVLGAHIVFPASDVNTGKSATSRFVDLRSSIWLESTTCGYSLYERGYLSRLNAYLMHALTLT